MVARWADPLFRGMAMRVAISTFKQRLRVADDGRHLTIGQAREHVGVTAKPIRTILKGGALGRLERRPL